MARKPVALVLPALAELNPGVQRFSSHENQKAALLARLRDMIAHVRQDKAVSFYPMRMVADFFKVSFKTVALAYEQLEAEGLLTRVRGSQTLVQGHRSAPRHPVRGVVGLPIYLPGFVIGSEGRSFYMRLEEELRRYHFVADLIFHRHEDQSSHELAERILEHHLDLVFWLNPSGEIVPSMHRLHDGGIPQVVVADGKARLPWQQYLYDLERALTEGIAQWQREGISSVIVLQSRTDRAAHQGHLVRQILERRKAAYEVLDLSDEEVPPRIERLVRRPGLGVVFLKHQWYEQLCHEFPQDMEKLFRGCRVLLVQGPVYQPSFRRKPVWADAIVFPSDEMATRIARDISTQKVFTRQSLATFYSRWSPRVDLGKISREI